MLSAWSCEDVLILLMGQRYVLVISCCVKGYPQMEQPKTILPLLWVRNPGAAQLSGSGSESHEAID